MKYRDFHHYQELVARLLGDYWILYISEKDQEMIEEGFQEDIPPIEVAAKVINQQKERGL